MFNTDYKLLTSYPVSRAELDMISNDFMDSKGCNGYLAINWFVFTCRFLLVVDFRQIRELNSVARPVSFPVIGRRPSDLKNGRSQNADLMNRENWAVVKNPHDQDFYPKGL